MTFELPIIVLLTIGCASPLLTYLHLWQIKEWRYDRLREHLEHEGYVSQLFGLTRPIIAGTWLLAWITAAFIAPTIRVPLPWLLGYSASFAVLTLMQFMLRRQPMPVWTKKAMAIFSFSLALLFILISIGTSVTIESPEGHRLPALIFLPILAPFLTPLSASFIHALLWPLDTFLKQRTMVRAMEIRRKHPALHVIGITGSVGKTTTKELLKHLLSDQGAKATPIHVNTEMGVARWLHETLRGEPEDSEKILIVEMGAYRKGEIALLSRIAQPTIGVVTYVGRQHLALFGSQEKIAEAKSELLRALPEHGHGFVNADSPLVDSLLKEASSEVTTVGTDHRAKLQATDIEETGKGIRFRAFDTTFEVPLAGTHMVTNILLAIAVSKFLGVPLPRIQEKLRTFSAFERTFALREEQGITILDNSYNTSVEGFLAVIDWAAKRPEQEKILLFDGIIELGDDEARIHQEIAAKASNVFSWAYVVHKRFLPYFRTGGFEGRISPALGSHQRLASGSLLVCMGRMPQSLINSFLPGRDVPATLQPVTTEAAAQKNLITKNQ